VIDLQAGGLDPDTHALATRMLRWLAAAVFFGGIFAVTETRLNASHHFSAPARGRLVGKLVVVALLAVFASRGEPMLLAIVFLAGALVQLVAIGREGASVWQGVRTKLLPFVPGMGEVAALLLPALVWMMLDQFKFLIDQNFASRLDRGQLAALTYASRIVNTVVAVTAASYLTAAFPKLADLMADGGAVGEEATRAGKRVLTFALLGAAVAMSGAELLVRLSFERGAFARADTLSTAGALIAYGPSILFISFNMLLKILLFLRRRGGLIVGVGLVELALNAGLNALLIDRYGIAGLAAASSVTTLVVLVGVGPLLAREGLFDPRALSSVFARLLPGAVLAFGVVHVAVERVATASPLVAAGGGIASVVVATLVYAAWAHVARVHRWPRIGDIGGRRG
jgi:putative peptidoglycan lipid II flippase